MLEKLLAEARAAMMRLPLRSVSTSSSLDILTNRTQLSKYDALNNFERQTNVPKVYVVLGLGALYFFLVFFNIGANFLINTVGFAIPAYYSLDALFSTGKADDTQWLTYWVVYAFLTFFESAVNAVYWFPFYYTFKFVLVLWMALPQTKYVMKPRPEKLISQY